MIAKQEAKIEQAEDENQTHQQIAELYSTLVGIKMVYNQILLIEVNNNVVSDEMIEKLWTHSPS
ncbi:MAG TPA: hypothetical protein VI338_07160 [Nitrososphaera sp.]|nr:hypothetical protein [Nitrososphaera sp.]